MAKEEEAISQTPNFLPSIKGMEEKQKILKDRLLLIGENLISFREETEKDILSLKKEMEILKENLQKVTRIIETISGEMSNVAKKEDLDILKKQAKMFQPMEFATKADLEKLKKK